MFLSDLSVRRPVVAAVGAILLTITGIVGYLNLSVREYPETDPPVVSVQTNYTGAAGAARKLEAALADKKDDGPHHPAPAE